jgi:hypothetical protein
MSFEPRRLPGRLPACRVVVPAYCKRLSATARKSFCPEGSQSQAARAGGNRCQAMRHQAAATYDTTRRKVANQPVLVRQRQVSNGAGT